MGRLIRTAFGAILTPQRALNAFAFIMFLAISPGAQSYIPREQISLDLDRVRVMKPRARLTREEIATVIPLDLSATSDSAVVGKKIVDKGLQSLMNGQYFHNPEFAATAKKIENALKTDISLGGGTEPGDVQHVIKVEVMAAQKAAKLNYSGYVDADVVYEPDNRQFRVALHENLSPRTEMLLNHETLTQTSMVTMRWAW